MFRAFVETNSQLTLQPVVTTHLPDILLPPGLAKGVATAGCQAEASVMGNPVLPPELLPDLLASQHCIRLLPHLYLSVLPPAGLARGMATSHFQADTVNLGNHVRLPGAFPEDKANRCHNRFLPCL